MKTFFRSAFLALIVMSMAACASTTPNNGAIALPADAQPHVVAACTKVDQFAAKYAEYKPQVIANREWIDELFPGLWATLADFDANAAHYKAVIDILCRLYAGDAAAQGDLDAKRLEFQRQGLDWNAILLGALKLAPLLL